MEHAQILTGRKAGFIRIIPDAGFMLLCKRTGQMYSDAYIKIEDAHNFITVEQ